ncbi:MAG: aminomethyltransferase family protein [Planctomycetota bacterium]
MPIPSPFHERTFALCTSLRWKDWSGYYAVCSYDTGHEREYFAFRHAAGLIDVTPLFKYEVRGPDAGDFLAHVMVKDVRKLKVGQATYLCWCDEQGWMVDDGTVTRLAEDSYRVTAAEPSWAWLQRYRRGYDVELEDSTARIGALSIQGPRSRDILKDCSDANLDDLGFFHGTRAQLDDLDVWISRTGYTGDLGYEVWIDADRALPLWDALMAAGHSHGLEAAALDAMDVTRIEAGFIMNGVDYFSAHHCMIDSRKSTPYEMGLGWTVQLDREPFIGQAALRAEKERGPERRFVGLVLDWDEFEALYAEHDLPPEVCSAAWRDGVPVYDKHGRHVGKATSGAWSPLLKKNLALADLETSAAAIGTQLDFEVTVEYQRRTVTATVTKKPFYDPARKRG